MMTKTLLFLCCLPLLFPSLSFAEDKGHGVEVRSTSPRLLETEPGKIVTGSFLVSNHTGSEEELFEKLALPAGWQKVISDELPLALKTGEKRVRIVAFLVPLTSPAGHYPVGYSVRSQRDYAIADSDSLWVAVLPVIKLELLVEDKPEVVIAGEAYEVRLRLANQGNSKANVRLKIKSAPNYTVSMEPSEIALEAGKSEIIRLEVDTDQKLKKRVKNVLDIRAEVEESENEVFAVRQTVSVDVIPKVTGELDPYHRLPVEIALIGAGQDGRCGFQAEFVGSGSLDEQGRRRVGFLFRGPDIQDKGTYGQRDELRVRYSNEHLNLLLGDGTYSLSPLTERFKYGRGLETNAHHGKLGLGAFCLNNRWGNPRTREVGAYVEYQFNDKYGLKGNFLNRNTESTASSGRSDDEIYSVQAEIKPDETMDLNLELGLGESEREERFRDLAFRIDLDGRLPNRVHYSFEKIYAGAKYFGYYKDVNYTNGTVILPLDERLRGNLSYRTYKNNLDVDSTKGTANREKCYRAGILYRFPFGTSISLGYEDLVREDYVVPSSYHYQERTLRLGLAQTFRNLSLRTDIERGDFENRLLASKNSNLERYSLHAHFRPSQRQTHSLHARIGHSSFIGSPKRTKNLGYSSSWHIRDNISFNLNYRWDESGSGETQRRSIILSTLTCRFPNDHALVLRGQWSEHMGREKGDFSIFAKYTIPSRIPVSKKKSIGVLRGKVHDEEDPARPPVPKVVLTAGRASALTDDDGEFIFPSLEPGTYYLRAEKSSIGLKRVTTEKLPIVIEVEGGKTTKLKIGVVTSCRISGQVEVFATSSARGLGYDESTSKKNLFLIGSGGESGSERHDLKKGSGLANTLVEITDGKEILRQLTDQKGRFSFEDIRPGTWILKVYDQDLPAYHYLEQEEFQIELKPGEERKVAARVLPRHRPIRIIDEGQIEPEGK